MPPIVRAAGRISVVIPTLNEAERLPQLLAALDREPELREIIVADGGSNDGTPVIAKTNGRIGDRGRAGTRRRPSRGSGGRGR
jgi:glycosyltransferase involved in cell wall biosynthesis